MKLRFQFNQSQRQLCQGITLIECLVYIGALAVVFGMGLTALYRCIENNAMLRRNSDDITQTLAAGELWRADIRTATQAPVLDGTNQTLRIAQANAEISYRFSDHQIQRRASAGNEWQVILPRVEQSEMSPDSRSHVTAWRWEVELKTRRQPAILRPLFTFTAVTGQP